VETSPQPQPAASPRRPGRARAAARRRWTHPSSLVMGDHTTDHHHRDVSGGAARAAVLGVSDGLLTNVALILGVAGAHPGGSFVRLAGVAGLVAGAWSMAAGEYLSMSAQGELLERELELERRELRRHPAAEQRELARIYERRGLGAGAADEMASHVMRDPDTALETHAREELGINPGSLGAPRQAALSSLGSFAVGAAIPLSPWLFVHGIPAVVASVVLGAIAAVLIGLALAAFTGRSLVRTVARQLGFLVVATAVTYGVGTAFGVSTG
jgi:vacuolar iron transporter family protein